VLSAVLQCDGQQRSATQTRHQALADADHLEILHAIWTAETAPAREQRDRDMLMNALPPGHRAEPGRQARWLWRTLRAAELAGHDPAQVLAAAIGERDLTGARDIPAVIDARLRVRLGPVVPSAAGPWYAQIPVIADPEHRAYAAQIAAMMDARKDRIGEHAAEHALPWAVAALGPVPGHPLDRLDWQRRAASIGAWRELSGHDDPADPIGPEPVAADAELRRRHPDQHFPPLRLAEPEPPADAQSDEFAAAAGETDQWIKDLAAGHRAFADRLADRQSQTIPSGDPDYGDLGQAFPFWTGSSKEAILQPRKPEITPSPQILERVIDRDADWEAAD
jgi:hypothetical protein